MGYQDKSSKITGSWIINHPRFNIYQGTKLSKNSTWKLLIIIEGNINISLLQHTSGHHFGRWTRIGRQWQEENGGQKFVKDVGASVGVKVAKLSQFQNEYIYVLLLLTFGKICKKIVKFTLIGQIHEFVK